MRESRSRAPSLLYCVKSYQRLCPDHSNSIAKPILATASGGGRFEFQKRSQLFIRTHNETLSVAALCQGSRLSIVNVIPGTSLSPPGCFADRAKRNSASPLAKIAVGLVRLDYSAEVVQHADLCPVRARERAVFRVRDRVTDRIWPCIPDRAGSKPIAD